MSKNPVLDTLAKQLTSMDRRLAKAKAALDAIEPARVKLEETFKAGTDGLALLGDDLPNNAEVANMLGAGYSTSVSALKFKGKKLVEQIEEIVADRPSLLAAFITAGGDPAAIDPALADEPEESDATAVVQPRAAMLQVAPRPAWVADAPAE